jgi:predicted CXXCH cytochrome family protein
MYIKKNKKCYILLTICCFFSVIPSLSQATGIFDTKHNLSSLASTTNIRALTEDQVCIFCHTPHNVNPVYPLWNHELSAVVNYTNYWSETLKSYSSEAEAPPIDGFSKLCLSCHDGTIAIGAVSNRGEIPMEPNPSLQGGRLSSTAQGYLGTDLSGGHPISIIYNESLVALRNADPVSASLIQLKWPIIDRDVRLYPTQGGYGVQCPSCHDPHGSQGGLDEPPLWRKKTYEEVCLVCHDAFPPIGHEPPKP